MKIVCPICQTTAEVPENFEVRPFCSARCKRIDLLNWLEGNYRSPRELSAEDLENLPEAERAEVLEKAFGIPKDEVIH